MQENVGGTGAEIKAERRVEQGASTCLAQARPWGHPQCEHRTTHTTSFFPCFFTLSNHTKHRLARLRVGPTWGCPPGLTHLQVRPLCRTAMPRLATAFFHQQPVRTSTDQECGPALTLGPAAKELPQVGSGIVTPVTGGHPKEGRASRKRQHTGH